MAYWGSIDSTYSLAILNKNFALALEGNGTDVSINSSDGPGDFIPDKSFLEQNISISSLYQKRLVFNSIT